MKNYLLILILIVFLVPVVAFGAMLGVVPTTPQATVGVPYRVDVVLDTQGESANAIQATLTFPSDLFALQSVSDGDSPINFWVDQPAEIASGVVEFSGIMPGGFTGTASSVIGLVLNPIAEGSGTIALGDVQVLANDGEGTPISTATTSATVLVMPSVPLLPLPPTVSFVAPESFVPVISQNPNLYGGAYFLVFSTTDKGSGIDHYEVLEAPTGRTRLSSSSWQTATSPYLLQDQNLASNIYVRAVDHAGNAIVVEVPARHPISRVSRISWNVLMAIALLLLLVLIVAIIFKWRRMVR